MAQNQILKEYVKKYATGGKAFLIVQNTRTEQQRRFKLKESEKNGSILVFDLDNKFNGYLGWIAKNSNIFQFHGEKEVARNFSWIWKLIVLGEVPDYINFYHLGTCSICGRPLKDAISLDRGIGPECWKRIS